MNLIELVETIVKKAAKAKVSIMQYVDVEDISDSQLCIDERWVNMPSVWGICWKGGKWVYFETDHEKGQICHIKRFMEEEEACEYAYEYFIHAIKEQQDRDSDKKSAITELVEKIMEKEEKAEVGIRQYIDVEDISDNQLCIDGTWGNWPSAWGICRKDGKWVYFETDDERGYICGRKMFMTEKEACEYAYEDLSIAIKAEQAEHAIRYFQNEYGYSRKKAVEVVSEIEKQEDMGKAIKEWNGQKKQDSREDIKMDQYAEELFKNCNRYGAMPEDVIERYQNVVSDEIIALWKEYGCCSTEDGYFKIVNPDDFIDIVDEIYDGEEDEPIAVLVTGMADIIVYDNEGYFTYIDIRHQQCGIIGNDFSVTMRRMKTADFRRVVLSWNPYEEAVKKYGIPEYDECFAYEPLLSLGGNENVDNMKRANLIVHLDIVSQLQDIITF